MATWHEIDDKLLMAYPQKMVEAIILGLVDPLNQHLVKLVGSSSRPSCADIFARKRAAQQDLTAADEADQPDRIGQILFQPLV